MTAASLPAWPPGRPPDRRLTGRARCGPGAEGELARGGQPAPATDEEGSELHVLTVPLADLDAISSIKLKMPPDLRPPDA